MSTYREYTETRIRYEMEEEQQHREDPTAEDYEAALEQLGVNTNDPN